MPRALFVQYTDPAGYPPIQHSMAMLERDGWAITSVGTKISVTSDLRMPPQPRIKSYLMRAVPASGLTQKIHYLYFCLLTAFVALRLRPDLIYASDMVATPAALVARRLTRSRIVYHEHDSPNVAKGWVDRLLRRARRAVCREATCILTPNVYRSQLLAQQTEVATDSVVTVFNCPLQSEFAASASVDFARSESEKFWLYYHGSIVPDRLPLAVVDALALLPPRVCLRIVGYETPGTTGYVEALKRRASAWNLQSRLDIVGPVSRFALHQFALVSHIGLSLMPMTSSDLNMVHMVGASNKPFDYLANGCPLIVSDLPDWRHMFVEADVAICCDPSSPKSICKAVNYWLQQPDIYRKAQRKGIALVTERWNYELQFAPVMAAVHADTKYGSTASTPV
jgi:glycosyltransferase involved in cell wall biosynthesis